MVRPILEESKVHPAVRAALAENHAETVREVQQAVESNPVVVVGMAQNPFPRRARAALRAKSIPFKYIEYGSYLSQWRRRTALKMWTGWPTFPMIFVRGTLIGGFEDLKRLLETGELDRMLKS